MDMKRINAGKLRAIGYDARKRLLRVELEGGTALEYAAVNEDVWRKLSTTAAPWSYYRDFIEEEFTGQRASAPAQQTRAALDELFKPADDAPQD